MEAKELFISYGRDQIVTTFVQKLRTDLERVGFSVWLDSYDIPAGSDWHGAIGAGLSGCKAILPVLTNKYINSRYCVNELYTADGDKKLIFPIMFEDVNFEASESGQGVKFVTSAVNWTMCRPGVDDYNDSMSKLITAMRAKGLGGGDGGDSSEMKRSSHQPPPAFFKPLVGPITTMPFKVIPDVENPEGITSTPDGRLVVSVMRQKVLIFNTDHEKVLELGGEAGMGMGLFCSPNGVAVDDEGNILVADQFFIQKFSSSGRFLEQAGGRGEEGSLSIDSPRGLAIGNGGRIYIAEQQKHRVTILNPDLSLYKRFSDADRMLGSGHLNMPQGIAINNEGNVYVADMMNHVVQVFDAEGTFLFRFGGMGHGPGTTTSPSAVAIDANNNVYVGAAYTLSIFTAQGKFVRAFGEYGSEVGKFSTIRALHLDKHGILYVGEWTSNRIQMFKTQETADAEVEVVTGQTQELALQSSAGPPSPPSQAAALNTTGEGRGVTLIGGAGGVVNIGPGVVFGGHVAIQPGANVLTQHGRVPAPVAVPPSESCGGRGQLSSGGSGVVFAKSAGAPCKQTGVRPPAKLLEGAEPVHSMAVCGNGAMVVSGKESRSVIMYNSELEHLHEFSDLGNACVAFDDDQNTIVAISVVHVARLDMELNVVCKFQTDECRGLNALTFPFAVAIGSQGRIYIAGASKSHILNPDFSYYKTFADDCRAFGIAVSSAGNVYLPLQKDNTIRVFSPDGDRLFQFGEPGRAPILHMSLHVPMSIAIDCHDNVYVGTGVQCINKFDREGKFWEVFATRSNFASIPMPLCVDPTKQHLYTAQQGKNTIHVYNLDE